MDENGYSMKITIISDTHNLHQQFGKLKGDVLIHCGDMFNLHTDDASALTDLDDWFGKQEFDLILCTGGNHDHLLQDHIKQHGNPFKNATFLQDETHQHKGVNFYGTPWVPQLSGHAFFQSAKGLRDKWAMIPRETDVLITHTPPFGILDQSSRSYQLGCEYLANELPRIAPKLHCFGHVHASYGTMKKGITTYVNASSIDSKERLVREPIVFEI